MLLRPLFVAVLAVAGLLAAPAQAFCSYKGQMYAETTLAQEFADSPLVVRATVISADQHWSDEDDSWTIYHLKVSSAFKGGLRPRVDLFTFRNSGGFYLDKGATPDLGGEYLLFLDPGHDRADFPKAARGAMWVNYACGQSKAWEEVTPAERQQLTALSHGK